MRDINREKIHMRKNQDVHTHRLHNIQHIATKYPNRTKTKQKMYQKTNRRQWQRQHSHQQTSITASNSILNTYHTYYCLLPKKKKNQIITHGTVFRHKLISRNPTFLLHVTNTKITKFNTMW